MLKGKIDFGAYNTLYEMSKDDLIKLGICTMKFANSLEFTVAYHGIDGDSYMELYNRLYHKCTKNKYLVQSKSITNDMIRAMKDMLYESGLEISLNTIMDIKDRFEKALLENKFKYNFCWLLNSGDVFCRGDYKFVSSLDDVMLNPDIYTKVYVLMGTYAKDTDEELKFLKLVPVYEVKNFCDIESFLACIGNPISLFEYLVLMYYFNSERYFSKCRLDTMYRLSDDGFVRWFFDEKPDDDFEYQNVDDYIKYLDDTYGIGLYGKGFFEMLTELVKINSIVSYILEPRYTKVDFDLEHIGEYTILSQKNIKNVCSYMKDAHRRF